ncbi:MAG: hypothetical protein S4CHLAM81_02280 [Chlamydiales bacterium]|nr:hypothetical protein [Chlamydiales bacterium]MCH9635020.1 hypothetical protein [Chlamydiales bacterium]
MALTNEKLNDRFSNPFKLVTYAIEMAKGRVSRGDGMRSHLATDVLHDISHDEDKEEPQGEE